MTDPTGIDWQPIASLPDDRRDGRDILFAEFMRGGSVDPRPSHWNYAVGRWWRDGWIIDGDEDAGLPPRFRYWADIVPPE